MKKKKISQIRIIYNIKKKMNAVHLENVYGTLKEEEFMFHSNIIAYTLNNPLKPVTPINFIAEALMLHLNCLKAGSTYGQYNWADYKILSSKNQMTTSFPANYNDDIINFMGTKMIEATQRVLQNKQIERYINAEYYKLIAEQPIFNYKEIRLTKTIDQMTEIFKSQTRETVVINDVENSTAHMFNIAKKDIYVPPTKRRVH